MKVFLGSNATEAELGQVSSPRVLHLATHGFFLPEVELGKQTNPLQQPRVVQKPQCGWMLVSFFGKPLAVA